MVKPDLFDLLIVAGGLALVVGLWLISPAVALIVSGALLLGVGGYGSWRKGKAGDVS